MRKLGQIVFFLMLLTLSVWGFSKDSLDIFSSGLAKGNESYLKISKSKCEATLIQYGYFTLGTRNGYSPLKLDDNCPLTFGHPYALTSYPLIFVDYQWVKPEIVKSYSSSSLDYANDTLSLHLEIDGKLQYDFGIIIHDPGDSIELYSRMINTGAETISLGTGLVIDPGIGFRGDGCLLINQRQIDREIRYEGNLDDISMILRQKNGLSQGIGLELSWPMTKARVLELGNWRNIYHDSGLQNQLIYDLCLKMLWEPRLMTPGEIMENSLMIRLIEPDYHQEFFLEAQLPQFLAVENSLIFPKIIDGLVIINNLGSTHYIQGNLKIETDTPLLIQETDYSLNMPSVSSYRQSINLSLSEEEEFYNDMVSMVSIQYRDQGVLLDSLLHPIFIPAMPYSDTGLVVSIDSIDRSRYPSITLYPTVKTSKGNEIYQLKKNNFQIFENDSRIVDFDLGHYKLPGGNLLDLVFVFDVTGSMGDEIIQVKNNMIEFCDSLANKDFDYQLGLVCFRDELADQYGFTRNKADMVDRLSNQSAKGGGDRPENSLQALKTASSYPFRNGAKRIIIWITDADYHENDNVTSLTRSMVIDDLLNNGITVYCIGDNKYQTLYYNPIVEATGGSFYNIQGNFKDILITISRNLDVLYKVRLNYGAIIPLSQEILTQLTVHYSGLGGTDTIRYWPSQGFTDSNSLPIITVYPNPSNSQVTIQMSQGFPVDHQIEIFNLMGEKIYQYELPAGQTDWVWEAEDQGHHQVPSGIYLLSIRNRKNSSSSHSVWRRKIILLK